jgi:integrase
MARELNKLSSLKIKSISERGFYADGGGLYLQVAPGGSKSWVFRFKKDGRARDMGLGPIGTIELKEAREVARVCRKLRLEGVDPIDQREKARQEVKLAATRAMTFDQCRDVYIQTHSAGWKNPKHRQQWTNALQTYVTPVFGALPVQDIDTAVIVKALNPIWTTKPETAGRIRGRIETILNWATSSGLRSGENPARWRGHLANLLISQAKIRKVKHHAALPYAQIGQFMVDLRGQAGIAARALEFTIETVGRTTEIRGAKPEEFDLEKKVWTVPAERMKGGILHRVPLTDRAVEIVRSMIGRGTYVFPGSSLKKPLSDASMSAVLDRMGITNATVHGFRSSFRDWAHEQTNFPREIAEAALAHKVGDETELAYKRGDALEKRRKLMDAWSRYCSMPLRTATVTPLNAGAAR